MRAEQSKNDKPTRRFRLVRVMKLARQILWTCCQQSVKRCRSRVGSLVQTSKRHSVYSWSFSSRLITLPRFQKRTQSTAIWSRRSAASGRQAHRSKRKGRLLWRTSRMLRRWMRSRCGRTSNRLSRSKNCSKCRIIARRSEARTNWLSRWERYSMTRSWSASSRSTKRQLICSQWLNTVWCTRLWQNTIRPAPLILRIAPYPTSS